MEAMTAIDEIDELRQNAYEHRRLMLELSKILGHGATNPSMCDLVAIAAVVAKERDEMRARNEYLQKTVDSEFPEGCTPADARVLMEANHALAAENDGLRARVAGLNSICGRFSNIAYNLHQIGRLPNEKEVQMLKDLQDEYDELQRESQIEGGE